MGGSLAAAVGDVASFNLAERLDQVALMGERLAAGSEGEIGAEGTGEVLFELGRYRVIDGRSLFVVS